MVAPGGRPRPVILLVAIATIAMAAACTGESATQPPPTTPATPAVTAFMCNDELPDVALVIVRSPAAGEDVDSGFVTSGCSRTFESNVQWRLLGQSGEVLSSGHAMGGGVYGPGPFRFSVEFEVAKRQVALLEVFEEDVSEGQGFPPPRAVVPVIVGKQE